MNAPTIGASLATSASSATARVNASASATSVPADSAWRSRNWNRPGASLEPSTALTTRKAIATARMTATSVIDTEPSETRRTTTVRMTRPRTSSATAAPNTVRASIVARARRSLNTRAVIPTLVAESAAAMKSDGCCCVRERDRGITARHRDGDADDRHREGRSADRAELTHVHLHAHLEQEQDHTQLGEHLQRLVATDEVQHRRADDGAGDDLADDRRNVRRVRRSPRRAWPRRARPGGRGVRR